MRVTYNDFDAWLIEQAKNMPVLMGKQTQAQKQSDTQTLGLTGMRMGAAPGFLSTAQGVGSTILPAYQSILANPGYSTADKASITSATLDPIGSSFDTASQEAANRAARTRNDATLSATQDQLARSKAEEMSNASGKLAQTFANVGLSERDRALSGLSDLYGVNTSAFENLSKPTQQIQPNPPGFFSKLGDTFLGGIGGTFKAGKGTVSI